MFLACSIYSFRYVYHIFISYTLIFISCHLLVTSYILLTYIFMYFIRLSYLMTYTYTFLYLYIFLVLYQTILSPIELILVLISTLSCSYLHPFLPCIPINFNQAISTLGTTIQFSDKMWHQMPLNVIWLDSRLNEISIESKNTHNGVLTKELCKLQAVKKISNLQHLQQQQ